ncbi:MAG: ATP synthase F0 subunit B [Candidatus Binataceae bacterium]|jgi:F0F1-type ATP synthase membrane subunit b/b'
MKLKAAIAAILSVGFCPAVAFCAEAGEGGGSWLTLMFFALNFSGLVFILAFYAAPVVAKFFRDRASTIRDTLKRMEEDARRAQEVAEQAAARQARLAADKTALADEMRAQTAREITRMRELARAVVNRIKRDSELTAAAVAEGARRQIRARLAQVATELARKLIVDNLDVTDQSRLTEDFMERLRREVPKP